MKRSVILLLLVFESCVPACPPGSYSTSTAAENAAASDCWDEGGTMSGQTVVMQVPGASCWQVVASGCRLGGIGGGPNDLPEIQASPN
jgi:hypothetical protein